MLPALWILLVPGLVVVGLLAWRSERLRQAADRFGRVPVLVAVVALMLLLAWFAALLVLMGLPWAYPPSLDRELPTLQPMPTHHVHAPRPCDYRLPGKLPSPTTHFSLSNYPRPTPQPPTPTK